LLEIFLTRVIAYLKHPFEASCFLKSASEIKSMVVTLMLVLFGVGLDMAKYFRNAYQTASYKWY